LFWRWKSRRRDRKANGSARNSPIRSKYELGISSTYYKHMGREARSVEVIRDAELVIFP
jgi:hypothetical protein